MSKKRKDLAEALRVAMLEVGSDYHPSHVERLTNDDIDYEQSMILALWLQRVLKENPPPYRPRKGDIVTTADNDTRWIVVSRSVVHPSYWVLEDDNGELRQGYEGALTLAEERAE